LKAKNVLIPVLFLLLLPLAYSYTLNEFEDGETSGIFTAYANINVTKQVRLPYKSVVTDGALYLTGVKLSDNYLNLDRVGDINITHASLPNIDLHDINNMNYSNDQDIDTYMWVNRTNQDWSYFINFTNNMTNSSDDNIYIHWKIGNTSYWGANQVYCWDYVASDWTLLAFKNSGGGDGHKNNDTWVNIT
jgi:hypothetical protein